MRRNGFAGLDPCVHCGFCLQACPTFLATGDESDSPRGRIVLMRALAEGAIAPTDPALQLHLDRCLGCRACEPVCPSGVAYGGALEAARAIMAECRPLSFPARLTLSVMAEPMLRRVAMFFSRLARPFAQWVAGESRIGFAFGMLAATDGRTGRTRRTGRTTALPSVSSVPSASSVSLFRGCIMEGLFAHVHGATARTLTANGYQVTEVSEQGCCGALHTHAGAHDEALALARANVRAFAAAGDALIAVNSAGCGAALKDYGHLLAGDPLAGAARKFSARVRDVTELLAAQGPRPGARMDLRVAYDAPCHLLHAQRLADPPQRVLDAIPGIERVRYPESEMCCGSAGIYSLLEPELSRTVLARKTDALMASGAEVVATGNPGCIMQIGAGLRAARSAVRVMHPVELLDRSYQMAGFYGS